MENKKIVFLGEYNPSEFSIVNFYDANNTSGNVGINAKITGLCTTNKIIASFSTIIFPDNIAVSYETYSLISLDNNDNTIGKITWGDVYNSVIIDGITQPGIYLFPVSSSDGIYDGITEVEINFTNPVRVVKFFK